MVVYSDFPAHVAGQVALLVTVSWPSPARIGPQWLLAVCWSFPAHVAPAGFLLVIVYRSSPAPIVLLSYQWLFVVVVSWYFPAHVGLVTFLVMMYKSFLAHIGPVWLRQWQPIPAHIGPVLFLRFWY